MLTKEQIQSARGFERVTLKNKDKSPLRCRRNGATKYWKRNPERFRIPVKYGLYTCFYITELNVNDWVATY